MFLQIKHRIARCYPVVALLAILLLNGTVAVAKNDSTKEKLTAQVQQLVEQLDGSQKSQRDQAELSLLNLGPKILDLLPKPTARFSPEKKQRLVRIRRKLDLQYAKDSSKPSLITLQSDAMPLSEIFAAITKQSGNKIVDHRSDRKTNDPKLKVNFNKTPFWEALDQVLDQAKLTIDPYGSDDEESDEKGNLSSIIVIPRIAAKAERRTRATYSGIFRIEPITVHSVRNFRNPTANRIVVTLEISWEPRISPILISHKLSDLVAIDSKGNRIEVQAKGTTQKIPVDVGAHTIEIQVPLKLPARDVKKIAQLQSKIQVFMPSPVVEMKVENLKETKKLKIRRGNVHFMYREAIRNNDLWAITTEVAYEENTAKLESHLSWNYRSVARLIDPKGKVVPTAAVENWQTERGIASTYMFDVTGNLKGYKFIYKTPTALLEVPVKLKLKNLPLP